MRGGWLCLLSRRSPIPTTFGRRRHIWTDNIESFMSPWESERESNEDIADFGIYVLMTSLLHDVPLIGGVYSPIRSEFRYFR